MKTAGARGLAVLADASWVRRLHGSEKQLWIMCIYFPLILTSVVFFAFLRLCLLLPEPP